MPHGRNLVLQYDSDIVRLVVYLQHHPVVEPNAISKMSMV